MQKAQKNQDKNQDNFPQNYSQSGEKADNQDHKYKSATEPEQLKTPSPFVFQQSTTEMRKDKKVSDLMLQNKRLRISNKELKKQLEEFEKRLDENLKKRTVSEKKPRVAKEMVESMQLKNAYKQCEIYKREVQKLKKKQQMFNEQNMQNLINQVSEFEIEKQKLLEQIKGLKKLSKQQQKGLIELTGSNNYLKIFKQVQQLKQQNKKLSERVNKEDRETKITKIAMNNERRKVKESEIKNSEQKKKEEEKQNSQLQILKSKGDKDGKKIMMLTSENNKLNSLCEEYQRTIEEKDKQIVALRLRLGVLRKQTRVKNSRLETQPSKGEKSQNGQTTQRRRQQKNHNKQKSNLSLTQSNQPKQNKKVNGKYPRLEEAGQKKQSSFKWNHHQFSSKIKQVQVSLHQNGHINELNFRYEKGEPPLNASKATFSKFTCEQNTGEYIRSIKGGFKDSLLCYLILETNKGRNGMFGQSELQSQCNNFVFGESQSEFPGAFFGENSIDGINRLGCLVECMK